jgi:phenylacetate-CoA ligase
MSASGLHQQFHEMLMESQHWSPAALVDYQRSQLTQLLRHARTNVPFYANRLDAVFTATGDIDWSRWHEIPIVTREDLTTHRQAMQATVLPAGHGALYEATTSGSTGIVVTTTHNGLANLANRAATFRHHRRHALDWSRTMAAWYGDDANDAAFPDGLVGGPWGPAWEPRSQSGRFVRMNRFATAAEALEFYGRHDATYFTGRGKTAQALALEAQRLGSSQKFDAILGFATAILPDEREDCAAAFGARMMGVYSSKEGHAMAHECPTGPHHHINEELALVEILDDNGRPTPVGEVGRVVVTPLLSTAQPLIRYEQGDLAVPGAACSCGRTLKVIDHVVGRTMHLFRFPDGSTVAPMVPGSARELIGAKYWQIAQVGPLEIEVRYVPATPGYRGDTQALAEIVRSRTHPDVDVRVVEHTSLERADGGKFIQYVNETRAPPRSP